MCFFCSPQIWDPLFFPPTKVHRHQIVSRCLWWFHDVPSSRLCAWYLGVEYFPGMHRRGSVDEGPLFFASFLVTKFAPSYQFRRLYQVIKNLGGGFNYFFNFHPYLGKIPILTHIYQMGWNHQPGMIQLLTNQYWFSQAGKAFIFLAAIALQKWL